MEAAERSAVQVETAVGMGWVDVRADAMARVAQEELQDLVVVLEDVVVPLVVMVAAGGVAFNSSTDKISTPSKDERLPVSVASKEAVWPRARPPSPPPSQ